MCLCVKNLEVYDMKLILIHCGQMVCLLVKAMRNIHLNLRKATEFKAKTMIRGRVTQKLKQLEMGKMGSEMSRQCHFETGQWLGIQ